jgi:hypothetical protein
MMNRMITLVFPSNLPKSNALRVVRTVLPDVRLDPMNWVLHHKLVNHIDVKCDHSWLYPAKR